MPQKNRTPISHSVSRYAHPFGLPASPAQGQLIKEQGQALITDWSKKQLGPIPAVSRGGRMDLSEVIGSDGVQEIEGLGEIRLHALGDTGVGDAHDAEQVSDEMATDYKAGAGGLNPAFLFHLGDVIYGPNKADHYGERFYRPYRNYPGKILAIPGNHDGEHKTPADSPSLKDFLANFCADKAVVPPQASGSGIYRETMTQPGVYWLLDAPFVRIIGLYSNLLENPGYLKGITDGKDDSSQLDWLNATLSTIAKTEQKKALIIATHHPPYSQSGHSGSQEMSQSIDEACAKSEVTPDAFLSAHAHNYQRYTRRIAGKQVPYIVVGTGGMPPQPVTPATGQPADASNEVTYDKAVASLGYLFVTVSAQKLKIEFWQLGDQHTVPFDSPTVDLATHTIL